MQRLYEGTLNEKACKDLIIANLPKNLLVPTITNLSTYVPVWNILPKNFLESLFDFASEHLQDDSAMILIYGAKIPLLKSEIRLFFQGYKFTTFKDWWGMNQLRLANGKDLKKTINNLTNSFISKVSFPYMFILHDNWILICQQTTSRSLFLLELFFSSLPSQFALNIILILEKQGTDVARDDILQNFITKELQKMNKTVPWRGPRKCFLLLLQMLIKAESQSNDLVLDCTFATSNLLSSLILILSILCHLFFKIGYAVILTLIFW